MTPNELLLWLSARKEGSWPQFRGAVETLDIENTDDEEEKDTSLPLHQRVRFNLERLGHVEFDAAECEDGWRVVPPTLALCHHEGGVTGVLCGARTPKLLARIEQAATELSFEQTSHVDCPDIIRMHAPEANPLLELARQEDILGQLDTPTALLSHLPSIDAVQGWRREPLPQAGKNWDVKQFIIERKVMKWQTVTLQAANAPVAQGLFRFTRFQMPQYFLREGSETIRVPGPIGKYRILSQRRRRALRYDRRTKCLTVPAILRPPLLTERALILCSGFPPTLSMSYKRPTLTYRDIPEEVAGITAEVLRQDLR
jgi:hypothetical protein